jgi:CDP-paratose 2-epimerase
VGGGLKNKISLKDLTKKCEKISNNVCKKSKIKFTSNYDIPYYVTDIKMVKKLYKWIPKKNINIILKDIYKWMINNKNLINKF